MTPSTPTPVPPARLEASRRLIRLLAERLVRESLEEQAQPQQPERRNA